MKFFHVYNEVCFKGLEKNGLINKNSGFKIQHCFAVPNERKFNEMAAKDGVLYNLIKDGNHPFYVDRIAGGITYYPYQFNRKLIDDYAELLGDWFLGFQLHESASNRRVSDWGRLLRVTDGNKGPYDVAELKEKLKSKLPAADGTQLYSLSHDRPETYAKMRFSETADEFMEEIVDMFRRRMQDVNGHILPCDSYYMATTLQDKLGMRSFMPEVGWQIPLMRVQVAMARGAAQKEGKTWGTYYECWREIPGVGYVMPCFNLDPINEWYLTQETHGDDFTTYGANGGSSRLLQNRIYHYALMSGADYFSEEWGLNCSYTDMQDFTLSAYGECKKAFINKAEEFEGVKAVVPFAIVLPNKYSSVEIPQVFDRYVLGEHKDTYMGAPLNASEKAYYGHIEDVIKLVYGRDGEVYGNEGHVLTNTRFGDLFDIIYEDASDEVLSKYAYLIDATKEGSFIQAKASSDYKILDSSELGALEARIHALEKEVMPCTVDCMHWLVSTDAKGNRYLSIFNNEGNERSLEKGDTILDGVNTTAKVAFHVSANPEIIHSGVAEATMQKTGDNTYCIEVPAAGFAIIKF